MSHQAWLRPFDQQMWNHWSARMKSLEENVHQCAMEAGEAYGSDAQRRGLRLERDLRAYREHIEARFAGKRVKLHAS